MAMTAVPGAANATPVSGTGTAGAIIPDVISFDNNAADQDGDPENGLIKWCSGDITFNINKKLVPGTYTFRARLLTSAAAVWVKIPKAIDPTTNKAVDAKQNMVTDLDPDNSDRDIEVKFVIEEETSDLAITIHPATNYDVADNKYYLIGKCKDTNLESGLIFDESNFTTALESLNKLIDDYVNKVFNVYESQVARQLMNSAKEKVQGMITNVSNLTYDDYVDNGLGEEDLKQSPIYKEATKLFNQSTRIEADYQTKKLKKQIEKALEDSKEDILDADSKPTGEKTPVNPYLKEMADKALKDIETYDKRADEKTGATIDAQGNVQGGNEDAAAELDPKILEEGGFDVNPNFPPLKDLIAQADRVSKPGGFAHVIADALQLSDKAIKEREDDLTEKYNEMGDLLGDKTKSDKILNGAKSITNYYRGVFEKIKDEVDEKSVPEMTSDFKDDIKSRLENAINNNVKETSDYIKDYYTLYNNYKNLLATLKLDEKPQLTPTAEERYGKTTEYLDKSQKFDQQQKLAQTDVALPQPKQKTDQAVKDEKGENKTTTLTILESTNVTSNAQSTGVYALDFKAYVNGLNELDKAYIAWETAEQKAKDAYDEEKGGYANDLEYDNTKFFKEEFLNYYGEFTGVNSWSPKTYISKPGTATTGQTQDNNSYKHEKFLEKLKGQLEAMWGIVGNNNVYTPKSTVFALNNYVTDDSEYFLQTLATFISQLNDDPASPNKNYAKRAIANAKAAKELGEKLAEVKGAIQKLRERVASSPIYSAEPKIYAADPANLAGPQPYVVPVEGEPSTSTKNISYTIPAAEGKEKTWKQILFDFEKDVKSWDASWEKVVDEKDEANFDNSSSNAHSKRLVILLNKLKEQYDTTDPTKLADQILSQIEDFVKEGGVIDQQEQAYATHAAKDNYASWKDFLGPTSGALNKLKDRIQKDWKGADGDGGYYVKDDPDQDDYYVGYDQPDATTGEPDGKIDINSELVTFQSWKNIPGYNGESLNSDKKQVFTALINSFDKKRKEALAIYDKWVTNADTAIPTAWDADGNPTAYKAQADWEEPLDYEKANVELAKAAEMIDEVNTKLKAEFELPLIKEIKAQREHEAIRLNIFNDETQTDGNNNSNMAYVKYGSFKLGKWDNGRKGVSKVVMGDCTNLLGFFKPLTDQLLNDGPADQEAYDEAKAALNPNDLPIYERIEAVYKRVIQLRKDMNDAYLQGNPQEQWENGKQLEYKQIEAEIKLIVNACDEQEADIVANDDALTALKNLTNLDADNGNGEFDWNDLFDVDPDGNLIVKDLLGTSGYKNIKKNDDTAKSADDMLEPNETDEEGNVINLYTFHNQLADGKNQEKPEVFIAAARALREAADEEKIGGELYEAAKQLLADINKAIKDRTLDDQLADFKKRLRELSDNILLIDQHALENKLNYASMLDDVDKLKKQYDDAKAIVDNMPESAAKDQALADLDNAYNKNVAPLKETAEKQYQEGHAWKDDVQEDWNKQVGEAQTAFTKACDLATGNDNSNIVDANSNAYNTFDKDYKAATTEYYILVDKLEQLKNLDADVAQYSVNFNVDDATDLATEINDYLFSDATENPKDALDRIYNQGTADKSACNTATPAQAWASKWGEDLNTIKSKIEEYIGKVDGQIDKAMADWDGTYSSTIYGAAQEALEDYSIYWETYKPIEAMPTKTDADKKAKKAALDKAVLGIITRNDVFNPLYKKTTGVDDLIDKIKASKDGKKGYKELLDVNKLFDEIKYLADNFDNVLPLKSLLTEGKDIEAVKEVNSYKDYAKTHLEEDKQVLVSLGLPLDEQIPGGVELDKLSDKTFNEVYEDYVNIFFEEDAETGELVEKEITEANWATFVDPIKKVVGWKVITNSATGKWEWKDKNGTEVSECQFIHQLKTNADKQNQEANMAILTGLEDAIQAAKDYIKDYQVAPQFLPELIEAEKAVKLAEEKIQDPAYIASTNNLSAMVAEAKANFGIIKDAQTKKYAEQNKEKEGTMEAQKGTLPLLIQQAWLAEKKHLEADVNALRAEYKKYTEAGNADNGYNERIEGLWTEVEAAVIKANVDETVVDKVKKYDFKDWTRTDLVAIQDKVKALWKELRAANGDAVDMAAVAADLNQRLADAAANKVQDQYAAGAPNVKVEQEIIDDLIAEAQADVAAAAAAGDVDYEREKLEAMVQVIENSITARDEDAKEWTDFKELADAELQAFLDKVQESKDGVNEWVEGEYDLAANANSAEAYAEATAKGQEYAELWNSIVAKYPETKTVESDELDELEVEYGLLIEQAEDAAADFDLGNRLTNLNNQLTVLKNKAKNGNYPEGYLYANDIYDPETEEFLSGITDIEDDIVAFGLLLETTETTVGTTDPDAMYASLRAMLDEWILDDPDTEEDETELIGGIQKDINDVAEILGSNVLGDMNNDGKVTLADAKIIADIVLGKSSQPMPGTDDFTHADVNEDGVITIADASCAVNIYFYGNPEGINYWVPEEARVAGKTAEKLELTTSKTAEGLTRVAVNLDNVQAYTAFQMDMQLPEGVKLVVAHMGERANTQYLMVNELEDATRIAALSLTNKAFKGNSGAVLYLDFEVAEGAQENFVRFQNVLFVNRNAQQTAFELGGITPTGIQSANAETALGQKIYDLGGRMKSSLKKGVNIIKDAAGNARKVFSK